MKVDIKKQFTGRSYRVKGIDLHPTEPWILCSLFTGSVQIWNYETQTLLRSLEVSQMPVRACRFVARKNWLVVGGDDMHIRVYNYNTLEKVVQFDAHHDYIRTLAVHPTQPFLLSGGDDMVINLWNWDEGWRKQMSYQGHQSYVMYVAINPKDPNTFASACMDRTVKVWSFDSPAPNFTLTAHETKGVNFVEYYPFGDKPYLLTTSDDRTIKIFDYQAKSNVATLQGHTHNVSFAIFHPELPIIISGSEDSTIKIWNARSYKLEQTLNFGMERAWCVASRPNSSVVAMGFETGSLLLRMGSERPAVSMDHSGKLVWSKHLEAFSASIKPQQQQQAVSDEVGDNGEETVLSLVPKELGGIEMHPTQLQHSPNGRFVAVVGDGEWIVYTALAWRNKTFGRGTALAWSSDSNEYAVVAEDGTVSGYKNFVERPAAHFSAIDFGASRIFGGALLGVAADGFVAFYDWESGRLVQTVDVDATDVVWADSGELVAIVTEDSFFVLRYDTDVFQQALNNESLSADEGAEGAFEVVEEYQEKLLNGKWVGDCFVFTTQSNRLNYLVGQEIHNISHFDKEMYLLGYLPRDNAVYLCDKEVNVSSFRLSLAVIEYQTVVLRGDLELAAELLEAVPLDERNRVARFLESQGQKALALQVSRDSDHKFELALSLDQLELAEQLAGTQEDVAKFKLLGDKLLRAWKVAAAERCFERARDYESLLLIYTSTGDKTKLAELAAKAVERGSFNLAFNAVWFIGDINAASELLSRAGRHAEAAMLALTWGGDVQGLATKWKEELVARGRGKIAELICDPATNPERFPANVGESVFVRSQPAADSDLIDVDEPLPEAEVEAEVEPVAEIEPVAEVEPVAEIESEPAVEVELEPESAVEPQPEPGSQPQAQAHVPQVDVNFSSDDEFNDALASDSDLV